MSTAALVIGGSGLIGSAILRALGPVAVGTYRRRPRPGLRRLDASDARAVAGLLEATRADVVFLPAAESNVDWCELHPQEARAMNVDPALVTLEAARSYGARLVFFSSDYVFDGASGPYDEAAATRPLCVYGRLKAEIEGLVLAAGGTVIRTTTVFGAEIPPGKNFALRLVARLRAHERVAVPFDQVSTPTWADELARATLSVWRAGGLWNVAGPDLLARDELARAVAGAFGLDAALIDPVATSALRQAARRPLRGGLRTDKLARCVGSRLGPVPDALRGFRDQVER